jgi:hypothetical protein
MTRSGVFSEENKVFDLVMAKADPVSKPIPQMTSDAM